jgi:nucleoside-diphosphate-sugar epimerase
METGVLRFHNVYGAPTDFSPNRSQVIPSLISKAILYPSKDFVVLGSGSQGRSFVHVDDIVNGLVLMMEKGMGNGAIQLGTNYCTSIRELAETIVKISGKDIEIKYDTSKPEGDRGRCADCTKAEKVLGWQPRVSLEEGVRQVYEWIEKRLTT